MFMPFHTPISTIMNSPRKRVTTRHMTGVWGDTNESARCLATKRCALLANTCQLGGPRTVFIDFASVQSLPRGNNRVDGNDPMPNHLMTVIT